MFRRMLLVSSVAIASMSAIASAQPAPGDGGGPGPGQGGGPGGGRGGNRGDINPEEFRQRMMDAMKQRMGTSDEEWAVLQPKIEAVMTAQREAGGGGRGMFGGGRGFGGGGPGGFGGGRGGNNGGEQSEVSKAAQSLTETLQNTGASADDIKAKLDAYRAAKVKAEEKLKAAREDLKSVCNERQEAFLVLTSILE